MGQSRTAAVVVACLALGAAAALPLAAAKADAPPATTLTAEQRAELRARLAELLRQDTEGVLSELRSDGATVLRLDGRFQHAIVARPRAAGRPELACFDDPDTALGFLARDDRRANASSPDDRKPQPEESDR